MYHSKLDDLHHLVLRSKTSHEQHHAIRNFFELCSEETKKEFINLLKLEKQIGELTIEELVKEYKRFILPSLMAEHCQF